MTCLKDHGHEVVNPVLPHADFDAADRIAQNNFDRQRHRREAATHLRNGTLTGYT